MDMGKNSWEDGASEHIPTHLKQLQTKADAYQKAGDIKSANALRDKIKAIKTKHGMAPASTQKAEGRKPFDRLNTQYTKPKFNIGDKVRSIHNPEMIGEVSHNMAAPIEGVKKYKVTEPNGRRSHWDEDGMVKISDEEHAKGTPYYKPTQKTEVEDLSRSETRLAILAKGLKAAITLRGLVKAEKLDKASGLSPENQLKFTQNRAFSASDNANQSNDKTAHSYAKDFHNKSAEVANKVGKPHVAEYHKAIAKHHEEVANNPNDYQIDKPSSHTGLSPENKIKYSQNRADSSTEIAHGSNDATHHSNAAHFHRKAGEVANSVGHKVLANYHNNIAKYHENESSGGGNK